MKGKCTPEKGPTEFFFRSMEDGDYPRAINSILDCRSTIHQYKNYQAVTELMAHLTVTPWGFHILISNKISHHHEKISFIIY